jgi:pyruvate formate lyase activating enzyme
LDTNGFAPWEALESVIPYVDLFLYDIKLVNDERHMQYTGVSNELIIKNLRALSDMGRPVVLRAPIIAGINDDADSINDLCKLAASLRVERVELMPYQPAAQGKYEALARASRMPNLHAPAPEIIEGLAECMRHSGLAVVIVE